VSASTPPSWFKQLRADAFSSQPAAQRADDPKLIADS